MSFSFTSPRIVVPTTAQMLTSFHPRDISSLMLYAEGDMYIGGGGVSTTTGHKLVAGGTFGLSHLDFSPELLKENPLIVIYGVAAVETACNITAIRR